MAPVDPPQPSDAANGAVPDAATDDTAAHARERRAYELGYDIPARIGMDERDIQTPCLILELDALERNIALMGARAREMGVRLRVHGKMHKSVDVALLQIAEGGACGVCCQKPSEAEAFVRGGISDVMVTNQVRDPVKIDRLAALPKRGARVSVCVDDVKNVEELSKATQRHGTTLGALVEIDCGAGRCGVVEPADIVMIARAIDAADGLEFLGLQAYQGAMQHLETHAERVAKFEIVRKMVGDAIAALERANLRCEIVAGAGTGSFELEGTSGLFNELQCGSYAFMDADYGRIRDADGRRLDEGTWEPALFLLTSIMSHVKVDIAICDAGLKAQSVDSGLPVVYGRPDIRYLKCSDEHGVLADPNGALKINERLRLIPGHCDPTCNIHDWYVGVRGGKVEAIWPVTARGKAL